MRTTVAVELPSRNIAQHFKVQIHAGRNEWTLIPESIADTRTLLKVDVRSDRFQANGPVGVWAECLSSSGQRKRIPSPFLAAILSDDERLADRYHNIHPSEDKAKLTEAVIEAISKLAFARGERARSEQHARRFAGILLPDLLYYDPKQPVGFTFAAQNGRHPKDLSGAVVRAVLCGNVEA